MMNFVESIHTYAAYTGLISTSVFLIIYTIMYNWHKSRAGIIMNSSLVAVIIIAFGATFTSQGIAPIITKPIAAFGWICLSGAIIWRLAFLIEQRIHNDHVHDNDRMRDRSGKRPGATDKEDKE